MALKTLVKINNVNNLTDARYCAGMGVEMMGFNMQPNAIDCIDPVLFQGITGWVAGVKTVAEAGNASLEEIHLLLEKYQPDMVEVTHLSTLPELIQASVPVLFRTSLLNLLQSGMAEKLKSLPKAPDFIIVEIDKPLAEFYLAFLKDFANQYEILIDGVFDLEALTTILDEIPAKGICLNGGQEEAPGLKDFDQLAEILEALEVVD